MVVFAYFFEESYIFAVIMDPLQTLFLATYFKLSLLNWRSKFMEMTECLVFKIIGFTEQ